MQHFLRSYHRQYIRRWRCTTAFWAIFSICSSILQFLALIHPQWIGSTAGEYFGLYSYCTRMECSLRMLTVKILSNEFSIAALLMLIATIFSTLAAFSIMLLLLARDRYVFLLCACMQLLSSLATLLACVVYPSGWEDIKVREICDSHSYDPGICHLGTAFLLALMLVLDHFSLSLLGFILAYKQPSRSNEIYSISAYSTKQRKKLSRNHSYHGSLYSNTSSRMAI